MITQLNKFNLFIFEPLHCVYGIVFCVCCVCTPWHPVHVILCNSTDYIPYLSTARAQPNGIPTHSVHSHINCVLFRLDGWLAGGALGSEDLGLRRAMVVDGWYMLLLPQLLLYIVSCRGGYTVSWLFLYRCLRLLCILNSKLLKYKV